MPAMTTSDKGVYFITSWERFEPLPYKDQGGKWTVGFGHLIKPIEWSLFEKPISRAEGMDLFRKDLADAEREVNRLVGRVLPVYRFDALVSFCFNVGAGNFKGSTLLKRIVDHQEHRAFGEFCRWVYAGGKPSIGLLNRRSAEAAMFLRGDYNYNE